MTDEWAVGKLDLDAYLRRIRYDGALSPSESTLTALHRAHLAAIPFENMDVLLGRGVAVDLESIQAKLVDRRRGGYCFEHGQLFGAALERLGFGVDRLLARVQRPEPSPVPPRTHLTLRVRTPDRMGIWLADVGFGSSPPAPLSLRRLRSGGPQVIDGWVYEVAPSGAEGSSGADGGFFADGGSAADGVWELRELQGSSWATLYRFEDRVVYPADVVVANHYTSTHPDSWFTRVPVLVRRSPDTVTSLLGRTLTVTRPGHVKERTTLTGEEWSAAVRDVFGLAFPPEETARLLSFASPPERESD
jgi:N-hydroxyarylamine O-acetyltransferase